MDCIQNMNDAKLKPKLLQSLVRDYLLNQKNPLPSPTRLSSMLSVIKTHGVLKESIQGTVDDSVIAEWKHYMDIWVERVLDLVSSTTPDKRWMGTCLLGVTCEECHFERFIDGYSDWFQKLMENIKMPCGFHLIQEASCSSLSDLLTRLSGFTSMRKDVTSLVVQLIQPVLLMLQKVDVDAIWVGATELLCTTIMFFPAAVHRHYDKVEASIVSKIMSGKSSINVSKSLVHCLALLPRTRGDESSWSTMMQRILIIINMHLDDAFQGLKEGIKSPEIMSFLVPAGKEPPPPLGGYATLRDESVARKLQDLLVPRVSSFMRSLCVMLTQPYPVQVIVPIHPLLAVVERVLMVDGSLSESSQFTTALQQEILCSLLPALQLSSLELLIAIIEGVRSQLLPHAANFVRWIREYFQRTTLPCLRIKVYSIMQMLIISMGAGMAQYLAQDVIENAFADLGYFCAGICPFPLKKPLSEVGNEAYSHGNHKKRKHDTGSSVDHQNVVERPLVPLFVQIAALEALEALLTMGGSINSEWWRSDVDHLLIAVASKVCGAVDFERSFKFPGESSLIHTDLQLAALRALLASFLSPGRFRPAYLSQGLELFHRGKRETGTKIAEFCVHALLCLEVFIHPRSLPIIDLPIFDESQNNGADVNGNVLSKNQTSTNIQVARNNLGVGNNLDVEYADDDYWLQNVDGVYIVDQEKPTHAEHKVADVDLICGKKNEETSEPSNADVKYHASVQDNEKAGGFLCTRADHDDNQEKIKLVEQIDVDMIYENKDEDTSVPLKTCMKFHRSVPTNEKSVDVIYKDKDIIQTSKTEICGYDSDSASFDDIPDIVNIEPDSD